MEKRRRSRSVMDSTITARATGRVSSTALFHLRVRCGGQRTRMCWKPARWYAASVTIKGLADAHLADHGGSAVGF